ncbi:MAG TPA: amidohydrolase family protein [Clostridia bacterium]|nr:amidohydrolase family protein [Clostridia bacterium]
MDEILRELKDHIKNQTIINTHSHHLKDDSFQGMNLDAVLRQSYVNWYKVPLESTYRSRENFLDKNRHNSYFVWLQKALQELYEFSEPLSAENWDGVSRRIEEAHRYEGHHMGILREKCQYKKIILDTYWHPGSNNGHPDIFTPTFRVDPLLYGYSKDARDHDGNSPAELYGDIPHDLDEYVSFIKNIIALKKNKGCIALKSAIAYERPLNFKRVSRDRAYGALVKEDADRTLEDIRAYQDYLFVQICKIAAELDLPIQCHTGMGQLTGTNAMALKDVIDSNPETKFVLFHCSFPWMDDVNALLRTYDNVYPDLCWLPILSTSAAVRMLHELIEGGTSDKICWGCDTWTSEESYGALLAFRFVLAKVLRDKVGDGYFTLEDAKYVIDNIMYQNASKLYGLARQID